jgi:tripartite-type tricarboxylate transporter receptor subunit TctC
MLERTGTLRNPLSGLLRRAMMRGLAILALWSLNAIAAAQQYPNKPVRVVVPAPPGGLSDVVARALSQHLGERLGQPFVVENRSGASGIIGIDYVAKSAPDGYTVVVYPSILILMPLLLKNVPYDAVRDLTPVSQLGAVPLAFVIYPGIPAANLREFIALAKASPGKYAFGASGLGSVGHLSLERIQREAGLNLLIVPYKGAAPAMIDLIGGRISLMIDPIPNFSEHIKAGKMKPVAVSTRDRVSALPEVPTLAESGLAGFEDSSWYGLWGPAHLPRDAVNILNREIADALKTPRVTERLVSQGLIPIGSRSEEFGAFINAEIAKYSRIIKDANIKIED